MEDPNILEFTSKFAEQHDAVISFTFRGLAGFDVHMGKNGDLESITLPRKDLETMDRDVIRSVLDCLLMRLKSKKAFDEMELEPILERVRKEVAEQICNYCVESEEENANSNNNSQNTKPKTP